MARLILLTQRAFAAAIAPPLKAAGADVEIAVTMADLQKALSTGTQNTRLVSFGSGVIVPAEILKALPGPAYNFHPGPPEYPGIFPSVFALYDGAASFGVTLHEMIREVDAGPIVAVERFAIPAAADRLALDTAAFSALMKMLEHNARALADVATPLTRTHETWRTPRRTRKDFDALCRLPEDVSVEEFTRRYRAVGEGPEHALTLTRFGRTFKLESGKSGDVLRGGQPT